MKLNKIEVNTENIFIILQCKTHCRNTNALRFKSIDNNENQHDKNKKLESLKRSKNYGEKTVTVYQKYVRDISVNLL